MLGLATLPLSQNAAQELLPGLQRMSEGTVLLQLSEQIVCSFVSFQTFYFLKIYFIES